MWYIWLFIISFVGLSVAYWVYWWSNPKCNGKLPPGSMGLPFIGETLNFLVTSNSIDIHPFVKERMERYGSLFKTSIAGRPVVVSLDPNFNYYVLQQDEKLVEFYYMDSFSKLVHHDNMSNLGGYVHKYAKRVVLNHFGHEALKQKLLSQFEDVINQELHEWTKRPEVDIKHQSTSMLFDLASNIIMSCKLDENLGEDLCNIIQGLMKFPLYIPGTDFYKCMKKQRKALKLMRNLVEERLKKHSNDPKGRNKGDLLDHLLADMGKEAFLSKEFISYILVGLHLAVVESISSIITLVTKCLLGTPLALQLLMGEHEEIIKKREHVSSEISWTEYKSMTFTHYVINESLRLGNILPGILRRTITDIYVDGYTIPKGWIFLAMPAVHFNPNIYEDPLNFSPSRWMNIGGNAMAKNFIPFGGGNRTCAGAEFSKLFVAVYLHVWVTKYRMTKLKGGSIIRAPLLEFTNGLYVEVSEKHC